MDRGENEGGGSPRDAAIRKQSTPTQLSKPPTRSALRRSSLAISTPALRRLVEKPSSSFDLVSCSHCPSRAAGTHAAGPVRRDGSLLPRSARRVFSCCSLARAGRGRFATRPRHGRCVAWTHRRRGCVRSRRSGTPRARACSTASSRWTERTRWSSRTTRSRASPRCRRRSRCPCPCSCSTTPTSVTAIAPSSGRASPRTIAPRPRGSSGSNRSRSSLHDARQGGVGHERGRDPRATVGARRLLPRRRRPRDAPVRRRPTRRRRRDPGARRRQPRARARRKGPHPRRPPRVHRRRANAPLRARRRRRRADGRVGASRRARVRARGGRRRDAKRRRAIGSCAKGERRRLSRGDEDEREPTRGRRRTGGREGGRREGVDERGSTRGGSGGGRGGDSSSTPDPGRRSGSDLESALARVRGELEAAGRRRRVAPSAPPRRTR